MAAWYGMQLWVRRLVLQGRALGGTMIRELVCIHCRHAWRVELPEFQRRLRP